MIAKIPMLGKHPARCDVGPLLGAEGWLSHDGVVGTAQARPDEADRAGLSWLTALGTAEFCPVCASRNSESQTPAPRLAWASLPGGCAGADQPLRRSLIVAGRIRLHVALDSKVRACPAVTLIGGGATAVMKRNDTPALRCVIVCPLPAAFFFGLRIFLSSS
jgi:hypothetical protein